MASVTPPPIPDTDGAPVAAVAKRARTEHDGNANGKEDVAIDHKLGAVVLIEVTSTSPDFIKPWKMHSQRSCKGSGFVIDGQRIITNFHVVQDAIDVRLRKHGMSRRWRGKVVAVGPDVDLALLEVHEEELNKGESFWAGVSPVTWHSTLPLLQSAVHVCGFPTGGSTISVTQGVVSRIDCKNYRVGPAHAFNPGGILVLQIDAAINPGNSGGPAFAKDGSVVGVAFQSLGGHADGIGYLIPAVVCENFLAAAGGERPYAGVADVPFTARDLRNASLRRRHSVSDDTTGILITKVSPNATVGLQPDDVIVAIDGKDVGDDGSVELRQSELVGFSFLITCKRAGASTSFSVMRAGERVELSGTLQPLPPVLPCVSGFDCSAEYVIVGGLVFTRLTCPMLEDKRSKGHSAAMFDLVHFKLANSFAPAAPTDGEEPEQVLLLTEILAAPLNYGYSMPSSWRVLDTLNGQRICSLRALHDAYRLHTGEFFEFSFSHGGDAIVLAAEQCRQSEPAILKMHAIPSIASKGILSETESAS